MLKKENQMNESLDQQLKARAYAAIMENKNRVANDPFRLQYHIVPPVGLLNDPNGFVYFEGVYHLFFQWNPFDTDHSQKFWAHITSTDLIHWEWQPIALAPSATFDKNGCYSGSAIVHDGKLYLFYTGNVRTEAGDRESYQCLAVSTDGVVFEKKGPLFTVPDGYTAHFRDPKVWQEGEMFYLVIGAQTTQLQGRALLYCSKNIIDWELIGEIEDPTNPLHHFGYMWECPDFLLFKKRDVLLFSPQGIEPNGYHFQNIYQTGYLVGNLDRDNAQFNHQAFIELDSGFDFYAPQTTVDPRGRRILFGWMGLPEENEDFHPTKSYHWIHAMTIPRVLSLHNDHLYQFPVPEMKQLRQEQIIHHQATITDQTEKLASMKNGVFELSLCIDNFSGEKVVLELGGMTKLMYDATKQMLTLTRQHMATNQIESRTTMLQSMEHICLYRDTSSIEIFMNQGEKVFSARIFEDLATYDVSLTVMGELSYQIQGWSLKQLAT